MTGQILVVGAAGKFAGLVVPALAARGVRPRGMVRSAAQADAVRKAGAGEVVQGDLRDPASLAPALAGVERVFYISPVFQEDEAGMGVRFMQAAAQAGVRRVVFSSLVHASIDMVHHRQKLPIENALLESGMEYVLLRPAVFYQNMAPAWPAMRDKGVLAEPYSTKVRMARVDYRDVAEVAALALTDDTLVNGDFELSGDGGLTREEVAQIASAAAGRTITAAAPSFEDWAAAAKAPDDPAQRALLSAMFEHNDRHGLLANPLTLRAILGRAPRSLADFFADLAAGRPTTAGG